SGHTESIDTDPVEKRPADYVQLTLSSCHFPAESVQLTVSQLTLNQLTSSSRLRPALNNPVDSI
ncbi:hypothetical protein Dimus_037760, partial [Dionaea muscipula]